MAVCLAFFAVTGDAPRELDAIPADVRSQATLIVTGTFSQGRSPCEPRGKMLVFFLESTFTVEKVLQGKAAMKWILVNSAMLPKSKYVVGEWEEGATYLLLFKPNEASQKILDDPENRFTYRNAMYGDEIVAIIRTSGSSPTRR